MKQMEFTTTVDMELFREYFTAHEKQLQKRKPRRYTILERVVLVCIYIMFASAISFYAGTFAWPAFIITALFFVFVFFEFLYRGVRIAATIKLDDDGLALGQHHYLISDEGITASGSQYKIHINWSQVTDTYETKNAFIIQLDQLFAFVIRKSDVDDLPLLKQTIQSNIELLCDN